MFEKRSYDPEYLDADKIPSEALFRNLKELHFINRMLGGYAITLDALNKIQANGQHLTDIGSGGGDLLRTIRKRFNPEQLALTGIDLKKDCIEYALRYENDEIRFLQGDYRSLFNIAPETTIVHACLFFHHFKEEEIIEFLVQCRSRGAIVIINDLQRHPIAYYSIKLLTSLFSRSPLVRHDAPLSVKRGFFKSEWKHILEKAGIKNYRITSKWAFRHQIIIYEQEL